MTTIREALVMAFDHQRNGRQADAEGVYRLILSLQPNNPIALNNLGLIVPPDEAALLFRRAIEALPGYLQAHVNLANTLQGQGDTEEAVAIAKQTVALAPDNPKTLFHLGKMLEAQGKFDEAAAQYEQAVALKPDYDGPLFRLAMIHTISKRNREAADCYRRVLEIAPDSVFAAINMAGALEAAGQLAEAKLYRDRVPRPLEILIQPAPEPVRTVLILGNGGKGNVPLESLLPTETTTRITWYVEFATDAQAAQLPAYDVAFNSIGDADVIEEAAGRVNALHARRPVLNRPEPIRRTRRDRIPALLGDLPDVVVPPVIRLSRDALIDGDIVAQLAAADIPCPVLVRPIVAHGGEDMVLVETAAQLAALRPLVADAYYFTAFQDFRSPDGYCRKYRIIYVDRVPYAYHLAISPHWVVHYFSADMLAEPWKRDEERAFLEDPPSVLGSRGMAAITAIGQRLDLDFGGIDFSILPDGRVLVFEANATMLVHLRDSVDTFPYKHVAVPAIFKAFDAMLNRHAARYPGVSPSP
jgi:Tfp pilus assembly protein PilF